MVTCHLKVDQAHNHHLGPINVLIQYIYIYATAGIVINLGALISSFSHLNCTLIEHLVEIIEIEIIFVI